MPAQSDINFPENVSGYLLPQDLVRQDLERKAKELDALECVYAREKKDVEALLKRYSLSCDIDSDNMAAYIATVVGKLAKIVSPAKLAQLLDVYHINVREYDSAGLTVLHHACEAGDHAAVLTLLLAGGDAEAKDVDGRKVIDIAIRKGDVFSVQYLLFAGVKTGDNKTTQLQFVGCPMLLNAIWWFSEIDANCWFSRSQTDVIDRIAIICLLLAAGARVAHVAWDMDIDGIQKLLQDWEKSSSENRSVLIADALQDFGVSTDASREQVAGIMATADLVAATQKGKAMLRRCVLRGYSSVYRRKKLNRYVF
jgi:hypothetical protein